MANTHEICLDLERATRTGIGEAILCEPKSIEQIASILSNVLKLKKSVLLTRLDQEKYECLDEHLLGRLSYCKKSRTGFFNWLPPERRMVHTCAVISAGTSDVSVAKEAVRTLEFSGVEATEYHDRGVAGLWRVTDILSELSAFDVVIAVAGMDAALPTVLGGVISAPIIAVPTSVGYGVAEGGRTALNSILASCSSGLLATNIDNGYGAACAALRILNRMTKNDI